MGDPRPYKESMDGASDASESERETSSNGEVKVRLNIAAGATEPLKVYLRLRPRALGRAFASPCFEAIDATTLVSTVTVQDNQQQRKFTFTKVFPELSQQEDIFEEVVGGPLASFMAGHHVLLFAYGPTGSGKTYTMQGTPEQPGLIPRTLDRLFRLVGPQLTSRAPFAPLYFGEVQPLEHRNERYILQKRDNLLLQQRAKGAAEYSTFLFTSSSTTSSCDASAFKPGSTDVSVWVSCYEIYNENVYDLLVPLGHGQRRTLKLGEDHDHRAYVKNLTEVPVQTAEDAYALLCVARLNLSIAETRLNQSSSRSHCMFNIRLVRCDDASDEPAVSCLTLCDLAGSENPGKTGNVGSRLREAGRINNSLLVLGRCLEALRLGKGAEQRAPFRDSKLTQVMQAFFVGGGIVSLIVNVSPSPAVLEESLGALKFSAVATEVVPVAAEPRHTKCRAAVQRLSKVRQRSDRWSADCDASERSFDEDNVAELFETVETLQRELDRAQQTIAHLRQRVQAQEQSIDRLEDSRRRMVKVYEEVVRVKVDCAKVYMRIELDRKYKAQRKELVKARKEIARLRGETGPPRLSDVIVLGDSEDDSDESDGESVDESTSSLNTTSHDYPRQNAPSCSETAAPAEVRRSLRSTLQAEVDHLRVQLDALSAEKTLLLGAVSAERDAALDSAAQLDSLMQELADARAERNQAERDADRALEQLRELREEHREAVVSVELLRNQLAAVSQAQETKAKELASLTSQYQQQLDVNANLKNRLADMADIVQNTDALRHQVEVLQLQLHEATERQELAESGRLEAESKLSSSKLEHRRELDLLGQQHEAAQRTTLSQFQSKVDDLKAKCAKFQQKWAEAEASREKACSDAAQNKEALLQQLEEVQATLTLKESELECCKELLKNSEAAQLVLLERTGSQRPKLEDVTEEVDENDEGNTWRKTPASKRQRPRRQTQQVGDAIAFCDDDDFAAPRRVTRSRAKKSSISVAEQNRSVLAEANSSSSPLQRVLGYMTDVFSRASAVGAADAKLRSRLVEPDPDFVDLTLSHEDNSSTTTPCRKSSRRARK
ncbi:kinesin-like protein KIF20A isoform X1 [Ixodes scapularis]